MTTANGTYYLIGSDGTRIDFDDISYAILRDDLEGFSGYPAEYDTTYSAGHIGAMVNSTHLIERELSLHVMIFGEGREELESRRMTLIKALNPLLGPATLYWHRESGETYYIRIRPDEGSPNFSAGTRNNAPMWDCEITLVGHDPSWYSAAAVTREFIRLSEGFQLPFQVPFTLGNLSPSFVVDNDGSAAMPVLIELYGEVTAPIVITNETTDETITIRKSLAADEILRINTDRDDVYVTVTDGDGNTSNALYYCTTGSKFWQLAVGANIISTTMTHVYDTAHGTITYRKRQVAL